MGLNFPEYRVMVDGFPIDRDPHEKVLAEMDRVIHDRSPGHYISITNTEMMYWCHKNPKHGEYVKNADFSLCDGVGVILAAKSAGSEISRYNGPILHLDATQYGESRGWRHYYLGGTDGSAQEMARRFGEAYPGMIVAGMYEPPFRPLTPAERAHLIEDIRSSRADIVWVGLGLPKQEAWIMSLIDDLAVPWMVGVGASFDYHSGRVPWAPALLRRLGLEWLFRLIIQPRIRAKRYRWSAMWMLAAMARNTRRRLLG